MSLNVQPIAGEIDVDPLQVLEFARSHPAEREQRVMEVTCLLDLGEN